jgi:hypothetical protein
VRVVPAIFGGEEESRWLVAFTTPVEARGRSGFVGNYAELTAVDDPRAPAVVTEDRPSSPTL